MKKIDEYYKVADTVDNITLQGNIEEYDWTEELHKEDSGEEHIQRVIRAILKQAIIEDVHELNFEQVEEGLKVIFKQNGEIVDKGTVPAILNASFVSKLKTLSNLDPSVCEIPQLGKLCFKVENTILIASVSSFPTIMGERISLKIYKPPSILEKIIPDEKQRNTLLSAVEKPGIILVCGSPLSGKTHVIYSLLMETTEIKKNIMTIESIAKYDLSHINQCELNENIGFNMFMDMAQAYAAKSILPPGVEEGGTLFPIKEYKETFDTIANITVFAGSIYSVPGISTAFPCTSSVFIQFNETILL